MLERLYLLGLKLQNEFYTLKINKNYPAGVFLLKRKQKEMLSFYVFTKKNIYFLFISSIFSFFLVFVNYCMYRLVGSQAFYKKHLMLLFSRSKTKLLDNYYNHIIKTNSVGYNPNNYKVDSLE